MRRLLLFFVLATIIGGNTLQVEAKSQDQWLTIPLTRVGNYLILVGPEMLQKAVDGKALTYYDHGDYIIVDWVGYFAGINVWHIPQDIRDKHPNWWLNTGWALDFEGNYQLWWWLGARPGTHAT